MPQSFYICQPTIPGWCSKSLAKRLGEILFGSSVPVYEYDPGIFIVNEKRQNIRVAAKATGPNGSPEWLITPDQPLSIATCHFLSEMIGPFVECGEKGDIDTAK